MTGRNRYVCNPIYVGAVLVILGQALLLGQLSLGLYAGGAWRVAATAPMQPRGGQPTTVSLRVGSP